MTPTSPGANVDVAVAGVPVAVTCTGGVRLPVGVTVAGMGPDDVVVMAGG